MIDLILFAALFGCFYGGFKCGNKFSSLKAMGEHLKSRWTK